MNRTMYRTILAAVFAVFLSTTAIAQDGRLSEKKFAEWLTSTPQNQSLASSPGFISAIGVASRYENVGVSIDLSIFAGEAFVSMPAMEVLVQPMRITQNSDGKRDTVAVGNVSSIRSPGVAKVVRGLNGLIAQPQIIARVPENADAVQVVVKGLRDKGGELSIILPIKNVPTTGMITRASR